MEKKFSLKKRLFSIRHVLFIFLLAFKSKALYGDVGRPTLVGDVIGFIIYDARSVDFIRKVRRTYVRRT